MLKKVSNVYLYMVPPVAAAIGFGVGHVAVWLYFTLWAVNTLLMLLAIRQQVNHRSELKKSLSESYVGPAVLLIIPWILFSIFAGMGPPPATMAGWLETATEQQIRYTILIIGGCIAFMGFGLLKVKLGLRGERSYSMLGLGILGIALPLFILNMIFWGYYLTDVFKYFITLPEGKRPDWYPPVKLLFYVISVIEVTLSYLATALFAIALRRVSIISFRGSCWFVLTAILGITLVLLPPSVPESLSFASYFAAIPAIPFVMPYFMGLRLLRFRS